MKYYLNVIGYSGNGDYTKLCTKKITERIFDMYVRHYKDKRECASIFENGNVKSIDIYI